jgi:hypothetical protein
LVVNARPRKFRAHDKFHLSLATDDMRAVTRLSLYVVTLNGVGVGDV